MPIPSLFPKLRWRTSSLTSNPDNIVRQPSKEDANYHTESNPTYLKLLQTASGRRRRPIKPSSIPLHSWNYKDQELWIFRILVEICNRPDYNAYDIVKNWSIEHELDDLYDLDEEEWSKVLGSWRDAEIVYRILREAEEKMKMKKEKEMKICSLGFWRRRRGNYSWVSAEEKLRDSGTGDGASLRRVGEMYRYYDT